MTFRVGFFGVESNYKLLEVHFPGLFAIGAHVPMLFDSVSLIASIFSIFWRVFVSDMIVGGYPVTYPLSRPKVASYVFFCKILFRSCVVVIFFFLPKFIVMSLSAVPLSENVTLRYLYFLTFVTVLIFKCNSRPVPPMSAVSLYLLAGPVAIVLCQSI